MVCHFNSLISETKTGDRMRGGLRYLLLVMIQVTFFVSPLHAQEVDFAQLVARDVAERSAEVCAGMALRHAFVSAAAPASSSTSRQRSVPGKSDVSPSASVDYVGALIRTVFVLMIICGLAFLVLKFGLRRFQAGRLSEGSMEVLARLPVEPRRSILLVRVGSRRLVVGSSEQGMHALAVLDEDDFEDEELPAVPARESDAAEVASMVQRFSEKALSDEGGDHEEEVVASA